MRTPEQMFADIRNWELDAGEDFMDYFEADFNEANYLFWCLGKDYISQEQFNMWENSTQNYYSASEIVFGEEPFSVVQEQSYSVKTQNEYEKSLNKAYTILAEFLSSSITYQKRVNDFFEEN